MTLRAIAVPPASGEPPTGLLIGLHGWGANAQDLVALSNYIDLPTYAMLFPDAPFPHPQAPGGKMWYGFPAGFSFQVDTPLTQQADLQESRQLLKDWLLSLEAKTGVPPERTLIAGFSQGGAMTLDVGSQLPVAGLLILSGYLHGVLPTTTKIQAPILMVHGRQDPIVPISAARAAKQALLDQSASVDYHELDMGHEIDFTVLKMIQSFVAKQAA
ncbi:MAG: dienelactone hydrolase family protein [Synechococcales cyanobacterium T60_A2020_003]|nr:dienelactone hydrolase family protein [Synechococcales cyanobacterium T60_A2020_003]